MASDLQQLSLGPVIPIHILLLSLMWLPPVTILISLQKRTTEGKQASLSLECMLVGFLLVVSDYCGNWVLLQLSAAYSTEYAQHTGIWVVSWQVMGTVR